jgi:Fic-DOC domain mobile mystery protein B
MALTDAHSPGATPLRPEDLRGLKLLHITTYAELNEAEAANIISGQEWALRARKSDLSSMLSDDYLQLLHEKMYGQVWKWAGTYRTHDTNIGSQYPMIRTDLREFFDDARSWTDHSTFDPQELAIRTHHRIVKVHPFPNGNGRHSRLIADLLLMRHFKIERLPWGGGTLGNEDPNRVEYIAALQEADRNNYAPLIAIARELSTVIKPLR